MQDRVPVNPGRVLIKPENGSASYYATMTRADNPTQEGTPLNKNSLLKDTTAALFGLGTDAVPDNVFAFLGEYNKHHWKRRRTWLQAQHSNVSVTTSNMSQYRVLGCGSAYTTKTINIPYSSELDISPDGSFTLKNPKTVTLSYNTYTAASVLAGKYYKIGNISAANPGGVIYDTIYYIPSGQSPTRGSGSSGYYVYFPTMAEVSTMRANGEWEIVKSIDTNAYPNSGIVGDYEYQYIGVPFENAVTAPKIATGSYTGTGTYGASNPCSLTFDFEPKLIFMDVGNTAMLYAGSAWVRPIPTIFYHGVTTAYSSDDNYTQVVTWSGNTVSWYSEDTGVNALRQMNVSGRTYKYIAIG